MDRIVGAVPMIEADPSHLRFVRVVEPDAVLLDLGEARRLINHEDKQIDFREITSIVTTSTVTDTNLVRWEQELELIEAVEPAVHIPTDGPVYVDDDPDDRVDGTLDCLEGTAWMIEQLRAGTDVPSSSQEASSSTTVLPLIKGTQPSERRLCYRVVERLGLDQCAFYASQYFAGGIGTRQLRADLTTITEETTTEIVVLGLLSPTYLRRLPESVVAAGGMNAWRGAVSPHEATDTQLRERYAQFSADVADALGIATSRTTTADVGVS